MEKNEAIALFKDLKEFTIEALAILAPNCPATTTKTRKWDASGEGGPRGMICHYTGGPNGVASTRWGNENTQNTGSSWHMMVFDHRIKDLDEILKKHKLVQKYFKVTVFFLATLEKSTWHGNWTNRYTFGIENRNMGRLRQKGSNWYRNKYRYKHTERKGPPWGTGDLWWEPYTRGQIAANIVVGQALRAIQGDLFVPQWVLPHSAIWAGKSDTGCAWPMYLVRASMFGNSDPYSQVWLQSYPGEYELDWEDEDIDETLLDPFRDMDDLPEESPIVDDVIEGVSWRGMLPWVRWGFHKLGYHIVDPGPSDHDKLDSLTEFATRTFQKSTNDPVWKHGVLKADGIPGKKTIDAMMKRMNQFAINYASPL